MYHTILDENEHDIFCQRYQIHAQTDTLDNTTDQKWCFKRTMYCMSPKSDSEQVRGEDSDKVLKYLI